MNAIESSSSKSGFGLAIFDLFLANGSDAGRNIHKFTKVTPLNFSLGYFIDVFLNRPYTKKSWRM